MLTRLISGKAPSPCSERFKVPTNRPGPEGLPWAFPKPDEVEVPAISLSLAENTSY